MRVFALELNNDLKGLEERKAYIEDLIARLPEPEFVVLPELALCSFIPNQNIWQYADDKGKDTTEWALRMAIKYKTYIGVGFVDREYDDFYNRYLIVGSKGVCGEVTQSAGVSAVFKRGDFKNTIVTPFGKVAVALGYDFRGEHFYQNIKDDAITMILNPIASPDDPNKPEQEHKANDLAASLYISAFDVPVVYVNSSGEMGEMPGKVGAKMMQQGYRLNGMSKIYSSDEAPIETDVPEAVGAELPIHSKRKIRDIPFYNGRLTPGHGLFWSARIKHDAMWAVKYYGKNRADAIAKLDQEKSANDA